MATILKASNHPTFNSDVLAIQNKLNAIRFNESGKWIYLKPDGLFGKDTKFAIETFQKCKGVIGVEYGTIDTKTLQVINTYYNRVPMLKAADPKLNTTPTKKPELMPCIKSVADKFMDVLSNVDTLIRGEIEYAIKLGKCDPKALVGHFRASSVRLDPSIKRLQELFKKNLGGQEIIARNDTLANKQIYQAKTPVERIDIKKAQQARSSGQSIVKVTSKQAKDLSTRYVNELRRFDLVTRISNQLKKIGITGEIKVSQLKSIKIKAGGVFIVWSLKRHIMGLVPIQQMGGGKMAR